MKILLGTPVHISKDYSVKQWLECVSRLSYPIDLLIVDNSPTKEYLETIKRYCSEVGITKYKLEYVNDGQGADERIAKSRELIRREILDDDYDAWFTLECDQIVPENTVEELVRLLGTEYQMVNHNSWAREKPDNPNTDFGCSLIKRKLLEEYGFLLQYPQDCWHGGENWFKMRVLRGGHKYIEVYGVIVPILHLNHAN